jgi:hypothetical protein
LCTSVYAVTICLLVVAVELVCPNVAVVEVGPVLHGVAVVEVSVLHGVAVVELVLHGVAVVELVLHDVAVFRL